MCGADVSLDFPVYLRFVENQQPINKKASF